MAQFYGYTRCEKNEVILGAPAISNVSSETAKVTRVQQLVKV
jgi:hypothetical protein